ncbi:MAG TPA: GTP-binding protein, partial [Acetobacteraceae bacterium]
LADPAPVVHTLTDTRQPCHLDGIVVTVDAIHAPTQLREQEEARHQIAFADRILLTKTDLVSSAEADALEPAIRAFNVQAPIRRVVDGDVTPEDVFGLGPEERPESWLGPVDHGHEHHHHGIASTVLRADRPIPGTALALWLDSLLSLHGADVLRLKGIVRIVGVEHPMVIQAVHHVLHRPTSLPLRAEAAWRDTGGEIVVIQRGLPEAGLRASFAAALTSGV